jgi:SAM-dependent methyltransferase
MALPERLRDEDLRGEGYKRYFGGKAKEWGQRGSFQLWMMRQLGLVPESRFLDLGCGALRGGVHLIPYLNTGNYCGVDPHQDLVTIANRVAKEENLDPKQPILKVLHGYDFSGLGKFDFALAFAIPMKDSIGACLDSLAKVVEGGGKFYITHGWWFEESHHPGWNLTNRFESLGDLSVRDFEVWGSLAGHILPTIELTRNV